nr:hypothetical protein [Tanacetum cinerariifolium]
TYTFVHSETRSWSIPSEDPYEEAARQLLVHAPRSPDRRAKIPEADTPPRKRLLLTAPRPRCEVGESSTVAAARQPGPTMARSEDRAAVRAEIEVLRRERLAYEQETPTATTTTVTEAQLQALINQGVAATMAEAKASRVRNGYDSNGLGPRLAQAIHECIYLDFLKSQPLNFKGTEGVWNSHVKTVTLEVAQALTWKTLKKMMTDKYCARGEIKKLKTEIWELKTKGTYVIGYSCHFQELALMCDRMFPEESDRVKKYIGRLPDTIHDSVKATRPKTMQEVIEFATELMDRKIRTFAERQTENKRKHDAHNNQSQKQPLKNQGVAIAYTAGPGEKKEYAGTLPLCNKCKFHHNG